jgi:1-acyl-sn-glycerol-3-phosphate acyltransferase
MSGWILLLLTVVILVLPRFWLPSSVAGRRERPKSEIRGWLRIAEAINRFYCSFWHRLTLEKMAPLPEAGPVLLISNHTCGIDHLLLQAASNRILGFMVAREYYEPAWINWFARSTGSIPVNRNGRDLSATRAALRALQDGRAVQIFPEGHIIPTSGRHLDDIKPGGAFIAVRSQVPVIPAYIWGTPATNQIVEALITPSHSRVYFGTPIDVADVSPERAGDKEVQAEVSQRFRDALLALRAQALADEQQPGEEPPEHSSARSQSAEGATA